MEVSELESGQHRRLGGGQARLGSWGPGRGRFRECVICEVVRFWLSARREVGSDKLRNTREYMREDDLSSHQHWEGALSYGRAVSGAFHRVSASGISARQEYCFHSKAGTLSLREVTCPVSYNS